MLTSYIRWVSISSYYKSVNKCANVKSENDVAERTCSFVHLFSIFPVNNFYNICFIVYMPSLEAPSIG